jgi:alpha-ketoglutarate-dependent taurine dioxygenase
MKRLDVRELTTAFGAGVKGLDPTVPVDEDTCSALQDLFDRRGMLVFRDLDLTHDEQVWLSEMLIRKQEAGEDRRSAQFNDGFYVSNKRPNSAAPFGRLQFHSDTVWSDRPFEVLSLYGAEVEQPSVPTVFVSAVHAWAILPAALRERVAGLSAMHTAGTVRRGDITDVLLTMVERPSSAITPIGRRHPRTGETILYVCEQMTKEVVGLDPEESERLLEELFAHLYNPATCWNHEWRQGDLVVWDNVAMQHARSNVMSDGPARTLRKVASPLLRLDRDEVPAYSAAP